MTPREELEMLRAQQGELPPSGSGLSPEAQSYRTPNKPDVNLNAPPNALEQMFGGAKHAFDKAAHGLESIVPQGVREGVNSAEDQLRGLLGMGSRPDMAQLDRQGKAFVEETGPLSTLGEVGGDVAVSANPLNKFSKGAGVLSKALGKFGGGKALTAAADIGGNAAYSAFTNPDDPEKYAIAGGTGALGGKVLGKAIGKLGQPIATTPITQQMLNEGIELTPGQASNSWLPKALEGGLYNTPFLPGLRRSIGKAQKEGQKQAEGFLSTANDVVGQHAQHGLSQAEADAWIAGAKGINDTAASTVPLNAVLTMLHWPTGGTYLASVSALYGTKPGRDFLLGKLPMQEALRQAPELAPHFEKIGRAIQTSTEAPQE